MGNRIIHKEDIIRYTGTSEKVFNELALRDAIDKLEVEFFAHAKEKRRKKTLRFTYALCNISEYEINDAKHYVAHSLINFTYVRNTLTFKSSVLMLGCNQFVEIRESEIHNFAVVVKIGREYKAIMLSDFIEFIKTAEISYEGIMPEYGLFGKLTVIYNDTPAFSMEEKPVLLYLQNGKSKFRFIDGFSSYNNHEYDITFIINSDEFSFEVLFEPPEDEEDE